MQRLFQCRVNSVSEAKARILGPGDIHVKAGSSLTLTCVINQGPHDLGTVLWYKNTDTIDISEPHPNEAEAEARVTIEVSILHKFRVW